MYVKTTEDKEGIILTPESKKDSDFLRVLLHTLKKPLGVSENYKFETTNFEFNYNSENKVSTFHVIGECEK